MNIFRTFVREFLGEHPTKKDKATIFGVTFVSLVLIGYKSFPELDNLPIWKAMLFMLMSFDIFAGAIGNFTLSTQIWYRNKPKKRVIFFFEHFIHIGLLIVAVGHPWYLLALLAYTIAVGLLVNATESLKQQEINAAAVVSIGLTLFYVAFPPPQILLWLPAVLLVKLVIGFAIRRER